MQECCETLIMFQGKVSSLSCFFFFKQKTAYEMRISDWSSDVCSSDYSTLRASGNTAVTCRPISVRTLRSIQKFAGLISRRSKLLEIGRASCRERVCQYV